MTNGARDVPPTPSALLELKEERQVVREGYDFLDEKRLMLAREILNQLQQYESLLDTYHQELTQAREALAHAIQVHGLEGVQIYPTSVMENAQVHTEPNMFLGVRLLTASLEPGERAPVDEPVHPSPEARKAGELFRTLLHRATELAAVSGNLHRLMADYRRTQRRTRALEDVLIPELESAIAELDARLEEDEREEAIRVRLNR